MAMPCYLFVYGTLLRSPAGLIHPLLASRARLSGTGTARGELYNLGDYPGFVPQNSRAKVYGELYSLPRPGKAWPALDAYEEYKTGDPNSLYLRRRIVVRLSTGGTVTAWCYIYNRPVSGLPRVPAGRYRPPGRWQTRNSS